MSGEVEQSSITSQRQDDDAGSTEFLEALIHHGNSKKQGSAFLEKLYEILMNEEYEKFISWCSDGKSILIKKVEDFSQIVLPKYYKHNNFQSFVRQLNMYNFTKTSHDANRREFKQPLFRKGKRNLLPLISRKTQKTIRSIDSTLESIGANDLYEVATAKSEMLQGKSLIRCKSIDSSAQAHDKDYSLWEVVQELKTRVNELEKKLNQVTKGNKQENRNITSMQKISPYIDSHLSSLNSNSAHQCCSSHNDNFSPMKKVRSNSDKSVSSSSVFSEDDSYYSGKSRSRSISFSSYESGYNGSSHADDNHNPPRSKRGVDAILSAAEILHDGLPIPPQVLARKEKELSSNGCKSIDNSNSNKQLIKKQKSSSRDLGDEANVELKKNKGSESPQSDSSTSPLYFQEKGDDSRISDNVNRKPGLSLSRSTSIS